jgi:hypothetical protein
MEACLGAEHPEIADLLYNWATVLNARREFDKAQALFRRGLAIIQKILGIANLIFFFFFCFAFGWQ